MPSYNRVLGITPTSLNISDADSGVLVLAAIGRAACVPVGGAVQGEARCEQRGRGRSAGWQVAWDAALVKCGIVLTARRSEATGHGTDLRSRIDHELLRGVLRVRVRLAVLNLLYSGRRTLHDEWTLHEVDVAF